jgi:perosamine synthetase
MSFEPGAPAPPGFIPLSVPEIRGNEWKYVRACLDTGWVSSAGAFVDQFEQQMAEYIGAKHAVATVNGTAALHVALLVAGVQPEDEVLVSTLTFIAPVNAIRYVGAWPVFIDAEPEYGQMDVAALGEFLTHQCLWKSGHLWNRLSGRRVKAVLPVHVLGHPVDLDPLLDLARRYNLLVIEDASESLGATYKGRKVGQLGDAGCFSFNGNKVMTTGGGGMILTHHEAWAAKARYLTAQAKDDPVEYIHREIGYNYRLTNVQAALGCAQLEQIDSFLNAKRQIAQRYSQALATLPGLALMRQAPRAESSFWLYTIRIDAAQYGADSRQLLKSLADARIQARPLWQPIHLSPAYAKLPPSRCPVAERIYREALSLPSSVGLQPEQQQRVIDALRQAARDHGPPAS